MEITVKLETITLGEYARAEVASGMDAKDLLSHSTYKLLLAMFVHRLRTSSEVPLWSELESLRLLDVQSLTSPSSPDSPSETSNG